MNKMNTADGQAMLKNQNGSSVFLIFPLLSNSSTHCIRLQTHTNLVQHPRKLLNDLRERANKKKILYIQAMVFFKF